MSIRWKWSAWFSLWQQQLLKYPWASAAVAMEKKQWNQSCNVFNDIWSLQHSLWFKLLKVSIRFWRDPPPSWPLWSEPKVHWCSMNRVSICEWRQRKHWQAGGMENVQEQEEENIPARAAAAADDEDDDVNPRWRAGTSQAPGGKRSWILWRGDPDRDTEHVYT